MPVCVRARTWWECPQSYHRTKLSCKCFDSRNFLSQRLNHHALEMREFHKEELSDGRKNPIPRDQVHPTNRKLQVSQPSPLSQFSSNLAIQIYFNSHLFPRKPNSTPFPPIHFPTNKRCQAASTSALTFRGSLHITCLPTTPNHRPPREIISQATPSISFTDLEHLLHV